MLDRIVGVPLNFLAKKSVFNLQSGIYLRLLWVRVHRRTHLLLGRYLPRQNALQSLHEPAVDRLVVRKLHLTKIDLLPSVDWHPWHHFLPGETRALGRRSF